MNKTLERVYEVFGANLPERSTYSATVAHPVSVLEIKKEFRTWNNFVYEYGLFVQAKRLEKVKVVTKTADKVSKDSAKI